MAARTHIYAERGRPNHRATLAVVFGVIGAVAVPIAIEVTRRKMDGSQLLDASWAIPFAAVAAVTSILFARGARGTVNRSVGQTSGSRRLMAARVLAVTGICFVLSSSLAVAIYEYLVWKEHS